MADRPTTRLALLCAALLGAAALSAAPRPRGRARTPRTARAPQVKLLRPGLDLLLANSGRYGGVPGLYRIGPLPRHIELVVDQARAGVPGQISSAQFSPDRRSVTFSVWNDNYQKAALCVVDLSTHRVRRLQVMPGGTARVVWLPDGRRVVAQARADSRLRVIDTRSGERRWLARPVIRPDTDLGWTVNASGQAVLYGTVGARQVIVWRQPLHGTGAAPVWRAERVVGVPKDRRGVYVAVSHRGDRVAAVLAGGKVRCWDPRSGALPGAGEGEDATWSPSGRYVLSYRLDPATDPDGRLTTIFGTTWMVVIDTRTGTTRQYLEDSKGPDHAGYGVVGWLPGRDVAVVAKPFNQPLAWVVGSSADPAGLCQAEYPDVTIVGGWREP